MFAICKNTKIGGVYLDIDGLAYRNKSGESFSYRKSLGGKRLGDPPFQRRGNIDNAPFPTHDKKRKKSKQSRTLRRKKRRQAEADQGSETR